MSKPNTPDDMYHLSTAEQRAFSKALRESVNQRGGGMTERAELAQQLREIAAGPDGECWGPWEEVSEILLKAAVIVSETTLTAELEAMRSTWAESNRCYLEQFNRAEALQAQIDRLMIEHCPHEMTQEQVDNWKRHQKAVSDE